jgi:hypothetical protein
MQASRLPARWLLSYSTLSEPHLRVTTKTSVTLRTAATETPEIEAECRRLCEKDPWEGEELCD